MKTLHALWNLAKFVGITLAWLCVSPPTQALSCTASGLPNPIVYASTLQVASSVPTGAAIPGTARAFAVSGSCTGTIDVGHPIVACVFNSASEVMPGVYSTGVSGIGMSLLDSSGNPLKGALGSGCTDNVGYIQAGNTFSFSGTFQLVRTGTTIATNAQFNPSAGEWAFGVYSTGALLNGSLANTILYPSGNVTIANLTCSVSYPSSVSMATVGLTSLPALGSAAGMTPFAIGLTCSGAAIVGLTMDAGPGLSIQTASNGVINIQSGAGMASGIGVQILNATQAPFPLQQRVSMGTIGANAAQRYSFYARYVRTGATVNAGKVSSALIFTFDYQ